VGDPVGFADAPAAGQLYRLRHAIAVAAAHRADVTVEHVHCRSRLYRAAAPWRDARRLGGCAAGRCRLPAGRPAVEFGLPWMVVARKGHGRTGRRGGLVRRRTATCTAILDTDAAHDAGVARRRDDAR